MKQTFLKVLFSSVLVSLSLVGKSFAVGLPVSFIAQPSFPQNIDRGQFVTETFTIRNNTSQTLPLAVTTTGLSASSAAQLSSINVGTCGNSIGPFVTCTVVSQFTVPAQTPLGPAHADVIINYGGRFPLIKRMTFTVFNPI